MQTNQQIFYYGRRLYIKDIKLASTHEGATVVAVLEDNNDEDVEQKQGTTVQADQLESGHTIELHNTQASQTVVIVTESEPRSRRPADISSSASTHVASTVMTGTH